MKKSHTYIKHQAFDSAYNEIVKKSSKSDDGFVRPMKYHHAPKKLMNFTSYVGYFHWSNELYTASSKLTTILRGIYDKAEIAKSAWYNRKDEVQECDGFRGDSGGNDNFSPSTSSG